VAGPASAPGGETPRRIWHPLFLGAAPVLLLFAHNRHELLARELAVPLALALAGVCGVWVAARAALGAGRGALFTSAATLAFFGFGHARALVETALRIRFGVRENELLLGAVALVLAGLAVRLVRAPEPSPLVHLALDRAGAALVGSTLFMTLLTAGAGGPDAEPDPLRPRAAGSAPAGAPDIYWIVLDGFGRRDVLRDLYDFDSGPFLRALEEQGFFVAERARANYGQTLFSLASTLELDYLDALAARVGPDARDREPVIETLQGSFLLRTLRERGYAIVAFETGYRGTELRDADVHLVPEEPGLSEFQHAALDLTPLGMLADRAPELDGFERHRRRIRFVLRELPKLARMPGPKFVFAHLIAPHPPFVFHADGSPAASGRGFRFQDGSHYLETSTREAYVEGYRGQAAFLAREVQRAIRALLAAAPRPPVVIVQGDHGPGSRLDHDSLAGTDLRERMAILWAIHLPGPPEPGLHAALSPVNGFRIVLNRIFGDGLPLLPDRSYFATWDAPYALTDVTEALAEAEQRHAAGETPARRP